MVFEKRASRSVTILGSIMLSSIIAILCFSGAAQADTFGQDSPSDHVVLDAPIPSADTSVDDPILKSAFANPNPFTPDGDNQADATAINFTLGQPAKVTVEISDFAGVVKTLMSSQQLDEGLHWTSWTGTNSDGKVLRRGTYKYVVSAETAGGAQQQMTGTATLVLPALTVATPWVSANPFSPNGDGVQDTTGFVYTLNRPAQVTIDVFNWLGSIRTVVSGASRSRGQNVEGWTGTDLLGHPLANGTYSYRIKAVAHGEKTEASGTVTVTGVVGGGPRWIHTRIGTRELFLMDGPSLLKRYRVAVGMTGHPTPIGTWRIIRKKENPTWHNPNQPWSEDMPPFIGPGPSNPLGTRALYLNASGIRIHGTYLRNSIGRAASHGCIRMYREDSEELFELIPVGTLVRVTN